MTRLNSCLLIFVMVGLRLSACTTTAETSVPTPTHTLTPVPTTAATETSAPKQISDVPGFEAWNMINAPAVDVSGEDQSLILTLKHRALWFMNQRGVFAYIPVDGNFKMTADVYTSKSSAPDEAPGGDGTVQLGGVMVRNGNSGQENYVFIVVGDDGNGLSIETKNTTDNVSEYNGPEWDAPSAQLNICRLGSTFTLYKRHIGTNETWVQAASFDRPDLPDSLQVGVNIYSDSTPDLQVRFENIQIQSITSASECDAD